MIQTNSSTLLDRSRLVGLLTELSSVKLNSAEYNLAERLSYLIGLSGSLNLASALKQLPDSPISAAVKDSELVKADLLNACEKMIQVILSGFDTDGASKEMDVQLKAPSASLGFRVEALLSYEPYRRFYSAHQTEMALGLQALRKRIRVNISGVHTDLHQLAVLDHIIDENLAAHTRRLFNVIPKLLEERFKFLLQIHREKLAGQKDDPDTWLEKGAWLDLFYQDMREMLLAEFDVRLQPILGLLETLEEQDETLS